MSDLDLETFLVEQPPFSALSDETRARAEESAVITAYPAGALIVDAFAAPTHEVFVVLTGTVDLWFDADRLHQGAAHRAGAGEIFGYSALLAARPIGPRAVAVTETTAARIPLDIVEEAFATRVGARFLAEYIGTAHRSDSTRPEFVSVSDLVLSSPVRVSPGTPIARTAALMTERDLPYAVVDATGGFGLVTDARLRSRVLGAGLAATTPVSEVMTFPAPVIASDSPVSEAVLRLLDQEDEILLVTGPGGALRGAVNSRDFVSAPVSAGVGLHEQLRRSETADALVTRARKIPGVVEESWRGGLTVDRVVSLYSAMVDTLIRRAIRLVFERHPDLTADRFVWLSLGSNGRREALLSSDVDAAVVFDDDVSDEEAHRYRSAFAEVNRILADSGIPTDTHGASTAAPAFSRTNRQWLAAARRWLAEPYADKGILMISLLLDGRPIHGDPGLSDVARTLGRVRRHPKTLELLLEEALAHPARRPGLRGLVSPTASAFDAKTRGLLPIVNIARWVALSEASTDLRTVDRLRNRSGSDLLTRVDAERLTEVFELMQQLRLRHQLHQLDRGEPPGDLIEQDELTPIERRMIGQAIREVDAIRRRMGRRAEIGAAAGSWTP
ncbi:MAG: putative nucleotidyltransferase substrate binding domain-containing protein [Gordonia sp. (in: high G+C Gram-positive bacteria)]|uniref:putative nucleotidyltransferase substrate binding domain-containing protein n=1 Tax=Gordonia sp. (in: high G+C Gram-positive bacteria) TaxID=84139 RepID=UPI0039E4023B